MELHSHECKLGGHENPKKTRLKISIIILVSDGPPPNIPRILGVSYASFYVELSSLHIIYIYIHTCIMIKVFSSNISTDYPLNIFYLNKISKFKFFE